MVLYLGHLIPKIPHRGFDICLALFGHSMNISWKLTLRQAQFWVVEYNMNRPQNIPAFLSVCSCVWRKGQ